MDSVTTNFVSMSFREDKVMAHTNSDNICFD
jgi:hypothetical protein